MRAETRLDGKVCLITGATGGIGLETAKALGRMGATLVLVGRDEARTQAAVDAVKQAVAGAQVDTLRADLSSMQSVRALAADFRSRYSRLDVLLNNAGLIIDRRKTTVDGFEATLATNHLAPFLLTSLLMDTLRASGPARVVNVSSDAHRVGKVDFDDLQSERSYDGFRVYATSKLANILFTRALARRLTDSAVTTNAVHPGVVRTGFGHNTEGFFRWVVKLGAPFMLSAEGGAKTSIYLSSSPEVEGVSGKYFIRRRQRKPSAAARDDASAERLWLESARLTGVTP
ncbi:retinol dehydrogenase [Myxococcus stipitatus DSM 14675]|uniref:Retinol dehydrogenase n=1 Tax=Myxococcus stipitatus (strain DSM 14675 / JCM 12634 / Mx s8) TaxID=1278073 RepID=L7U3Q8_MYXSD|nr:SDR family oxidoreductase [Myxococcus stipitatus]AGC42222.1 retinol dehydrogenase [Myxococcus stipitatus DSM 14675]